MSARILEFIIRGKDEFTPAINQLNGSLTNSARVGQNAFGGWRKEGGLLNEQLRILRRSVEYSISGAAIYKVYQIAAAYKNFREELGFLNMNLQTSQGNLEKLGSSALKVSNQTLAPVQQVLQSFQNIAKSFPNIPQSLIAPYSQIESQAATLLQTDPQLVGSTISQLAGQFYGRNKINNPKTGPRLISRIANELLYTLNTTTRTTGQDLTSYLPMLAGGAVTSGFNLEQMLALFTTGQRALGRPSQTAQYIRQLMIRLKAPTKAEAPYFMQAGLSPTELSGMGGMQVLDQLIQYGLSLPGSSMSYEQAKKSGYKGLKLGGEAAQFFQRSIGGRIQSLVALTALVKNFGQVTLQQQGLMKNRQDYLNQSWGKFIDQNRLRQAANEMNNFSLGVVNDLNPIINLLAIGTTHLADFGMKANHFAQVGAKDINKGISNITGISDSTLSKYHVGGITEVGGSVAALLAMRSLLGGGKLTGALKRFPGLGKFGKTATALESGLTAAVTGPLDVQAISSALAGSYRGSASAPFWVVIHPLSLQTIPFLNGKGSQKGGPPLNQLKSTALHEAEQAAKAAGAAGAGAEVATRGKILRGAVRLGARLATRFPLAGAMRVAGPVGLIATVADYFMGSGTHTSYRDANTDSMVRIGGGGYTSMVPRGSLADRIFGQGYLGSGFRSSPAGMRADSEAGRFLRGQISERTLEHFLAIAISQYRHSHPNQSKAQVDGTFTLEPTDELKGLIKPQKIRVGIPSQWIPDGSPAPKTKAKATSRNG